MSTAQLEPFDIRSLPELMGWFTDATACRIWGGPRFRYPFTAETFRADALVDTLPTYGLFERGSLVGFGQFYARAGRCHLGRLAVAPACRRRGFGGQLVRALCRVGQAELGTEGYSLFVLPDNQPALVLYRRLGFQEATYPGDPADSADCLYLRAQRLADEGPGV